MKQSLGMNLFDLTGRVACVTGGATGIGKAIATGLAHAGAMVVIVSRSLENLQAAVQEIVEATRNERVSYVQADLGKREDSASIVPKVIERLGRLDILVGDAAQDIFEPIETFKDASIDRMLEVNLVSNIVLLRSAVPELKKHGCGRVIFISSIAAESGSTMGTSVYAATKAGLQALARNTAFELGAEGITVNCVAPGFTLTPMLETYFESLGEEGLREKERFAQTTALKRWGQPRDMVGPVLLLASDAGGFMTGQLLTIDGGTTTRMK